MDAALQQRLLKLFHYALVPGGFLHLGSAETVGDATDLFSHASTASGKSIAVIRRNRASRSPLPIPSMPRLPPAAACAAGDLPAPGGPATLRELAGTRAAGRLRPAGGDCQRRGDVLALTANTGRCVLAFGEADGSPQLTSAGPRRNCGIELMRALRRRSRRMTPVRPTGCRCASTAFRSGSHSPSVRWPTDPTPTGCIWSRSRSRNRCRRWNRSARTT